MPNAKDCEQCGQPFARRESYSNRQWTERKYCSRKCMGQARSVEYWDARTPRTCVVCGVEFRVAPAFDKAYVTCGSGDCQRSYRRTVSAQKTGKAAREAYASGARKPASGISPREVTLWPALRSEGWFWHLRWADSEGIRELDFAHVAPGRLLNVEIDGREHTFKARRAKDAARDAYLASLGWKILRIPNAEVDADPEAVLERIREWALTP